MEEHISATIQTLADEAVRVISGCLAASYAHGERLVSKYHVSLMVIWSSSL